jgi:hypothetical protein
MSGDTPERSVAPQPPAPSAAGDRGRRVSNVTDPAIAREIDDNLRRVYQAAVDEGVPERFRKLLAELRAKEQDS